VKEQREEESVRKRNETTVNKTSGRKNEWRKWRKETKEKWWEKMTQGTYKER
jgi:hypothetical protein